jgi:hypothetical protein
MMKRILSALLLAVSCLISIPSVVLAQDSGAPVFSQAELDQLLAPVALYPDPLLSQILIAATYPLETVQAARFLQQNPGLTGDALAQAAAAQPWDPSVKALLQFPSVLSMMDQQLSWTQRLGDAFLAQQANVMDTVQNLRARAQAAGNLNSTSQQQVTVQDNVVSIQPYQPDVIYVPYYDPTLVYGNWWWPQYPPLVWVPPVAYRPAAYGNLVAGGIVFGGGIFLSGSLFIYCMPDWYHHHFIDYGPGRYVPSKPGIVWTHNPQHRLGVAYRDDATRNRFQPGSAPSPARDAWRGHVNPGNGGFGNPPVTVRPGTPGNASPAPSRGIERMPNIGNTTPAAPAPTRTAPEPMRSGPEPMRTAPAPSFEPSHPFAPNGPANQMDTHSDRGRESREAAGMPAMSAPRFEPRSAPAAEPRAEQRRLPR